MTHKKGIKDHCSERRQEWAVETDSYTHERDPRRFETRGVTIFRHLTPSKLWGSRAFDGLRTHRISHVGL